MNRRVLIILGALLALIVIVAGVLIFIQAKKTPSVVQQNTTDTSGQNTDTSGNSGQNSDTGAPEGVIKVTDTEVISPEISVDDGALWYVDSSGSMWKLNLTSGLKKEYLLPSQIKIDQVIWPAKGNDFIAVTTGQSSKFNLYNSVTKSWITYPGNIKGVDFINNGASVIYNWVTDKNQSGLTKANSDTSNHSPIVDLPTGNYAVKASPNGNYAFAFNSGNTSDGKLYFADVSGKKVFTIKTGVSNYASWSPDSSKFLFNKGVNGGSSLWLGDAKSSTGDKDLGINSDAAHAVFSSDGSKIYVSEGENIWVVDASTGQKTLLSYANPQKVIMSPKTLLLLGDSSKLYFVNSDNFVYSIPLK